MRSRSVFAVLLVTLVCGAFHPAAAATVNNGVVTMTTTGGPSSITLDISINDPGAFPGCTFFVITRDGAMATFFLRQPGVLNTFSFTDTNVLPNRMYWYELKASPVPVPVSSPSCDETQFRLAFGSGWALPIDIPGHVGTIPVPVAHGKLNVETEPGYDAWIETCGSPGWTWFYFDLPPGYEQYIGQDVRLYGDYSGWNVQFGWDFYATSLQLFPCTPVATENATWSHIKTLYR